MQSWTWLSLFIQLDKVVSTCTAEKGYLLSKLGNVIFLAELDNVVLTCKAGNGCLYLQLDKVGL